MAQFWETFYTKTLGQFPSGWTKRMGTPLAADSWLVQNTGLWRTKGLTATLQRTWQQADLPRIVTWDEATDSCDDVELHAVVKLGPNAHTSIRTGAIIARYQTWLWEDNGDWYYNNGGYVLWLDGASSEGNRRLVLGMWYWNDKTEEYEVVEFDSMAFPFTSAEWYSLRLRVKNLTSPDRVLLLGKAWLHSESEPMTYVPTVPRQFAYADASYSDPNHPASHAIDSNPATYWEGRRPDPGSYEWLGLQPAYEHQECRGVQFMLHPNTEGANVEVWTLYGSTWIQRAALSNVQGNVWINVDWELDTVELIELRFSENGTVIIPACYWARVKIPLPEYAGYTLCYEHAVPTPNNQRPDQTLTDAGLQGVGAYAVGEERTRFFDLVGVGTCGESAPPPLEAVPVEVPVAEMELAPRTPVSIAYGSSLTVPYTTLAVFSLFYRHLLPPHPIRDHYRPRPLRVLDPDTAELKLEIDAHDGCTVYRRFYEVGAFDALVPRNVLLMDVRKAGVFGGGSYRHWNQRYNRGAAFLRDKIVPHTERVAVGDAVAMGDLVMVDNNPYKVHIIEQKQIQLDDRGRQSEVWRLQGCHLAGILARRVTLPPDGDEHIVLDAVESAMKTYVYHNTTGAARAIEPLAIMTDHKLGAVKRWRTRYERLDLLLAEMSRITGLGWTVYLDPKTRKWIFEVFEGLKRYAGNPWRAPVILSPDFDSVRDMELWEDAISSKNTIYVGGQDEGASRKVIAQAALISRELSIFTGGTYGRYARRFNQGHTYVGEETRSVPVFGLYRREVFRDARFAPDEELGRIGQETLAQFAPETFLRAGVEPGIRRRETGILPIEVPGGTYYYSRDWDLGDIVTVRNIEWGVTADLRVVEVTEYSDPVGFTIEVAFAQRAPTLYDLWRREQLNRIGEVTK